MHMTSLRMREDAVRHQQLYCLSVVSIHYLTVRRHAICHTRMLSQSRTRQLRASSAFSNTSIPINTGRMTAARRRVVQSTPTLETI